jgi:hypothetical protein
MITGAMSYNRYRVRRVGADVANFIARNDAVSQSLLIPGLDGINLPRVLFGAGEVGGIWDWSDRSTMFQDVAGTQPITASGQTRALHLDKSQGLTLGADLVTNGGFDADSNWTKGTDWTIGSGVATKAAGTAADLTQTIASTTGRFYQITVTVTRTAGTLTVSLGTSGSSLAITSSGTYVMRLHAGTSTQNLTFAADASFAGTVDNVAVRLLPGNHRYQASTASRPQYIEDETGHYGLFDGIDDFDETNAVDFTGTNKVTVWWGGRKLSDAASGFILELGDGANNGRVSLLAPSSSGANSYQAQSRGSSTATAGAGVFAAAPDTASITAIGDIGGPLLILRRNGVVVESSTATQGIGNYANAKLYFGRRAGTSFPANIREYMTVIRGAQTATPLIERVEREVRRKIKGLTW